MHNQLLVGKKALRFVEFISTLGIGGDLPYARKKHVNGLFIFVRSAAVPSATGSALCAGWFGNRSRASAQGILAKVRQDAILAKG
jgi:hypothetical protein